MKQARSTSSRRGATPDRTSPEKAEGAALSAAMRQLLLAFVEPTPDGEWNPANYASAAGGR